MAASPPRADEGAESRCSCEICSEIHLLGNTGLADVIEGEGRGYDPRPEALTVNRQGSDGSRISEKVELTGCSLTFEFHPVEGTIIHLDVPAEFKEKIR